MKTTLTPDQLKAPQALIMINNKTGLFYNKDLGGFSELNKDKATVLDNLAQCAFVRAHFSRPEDLEAIPAPEKAPATRADVLAEIGKALCGVIDSHAFNLDLAGDLTPILEAVIGAELLTRSEERAATYHADYMFGAWEKLNALDDRAATIEFSELRENPNAFLTNLREELREIRELMSKPAPREDESAPILPPESGECITITEEGEPEPVDAEFSAIKEAADRIADHSVTAADYELACRIIGRGTGHPGFRLALKIEGAWRCDPENPEDEPEDPTEYLYH